MILKISPKLSEARDLAQVSLACEPALTLTEALRVGVVGMFEDDIWRSFAGRRLDFLLTFFLLFVIDKLVAKVLHQVHVSVFFVRRRVDFLTNSRLIRPSVFLTTPIAHTTVLITMSVLVITSS